MCRSRLYSDPFFRPHKDKGCPYMLEHNTKYRKQTKNRSLQLCCNMANKLYQSIWSCNLRCLALSTLMLLLIWLIFGMACFDCLRQLECNWICLLNIRSFPIGDFLANIANRLAGWLASVFCVPEGGSFLVCVSAGQVTLSETTASLSLAPAQVVLTTIGTGGVTLNAISEFRARRYLGVSMREVLHYYYPGHIFFMVIQILMYILGIFVMEKGMVRCSMLILFGVILCSIYAVIFSIGAFSAEKLTKAYIGSIASKRNTGHNSLQASLISNIAFHLGKEYSENGRELINWFKSYSLTFVQLLDVPSQGKHLRNQQCSLSSCSPWDENQIFKKVFFVSEDSCMESDPADWVFYRLLLNRKKQQSYVDYLGSKIKDLQLVWRNLFRPFGEDIEGQAEVAAAMLTASYIDSYPHFMTMVCSLSLYQHNINPNKSNGQNASSFLWQVLKHSQHLQRELCEKSIWIMQKNLDPYKSKDSQDMWASYRKALGLIELSVTLWENTLYGRDTNGGLSAYSALLEIADFTNCFDCETSRQEMRLYIAYGYATYLMALPAPSLYPSRDYISSLLYRFEEIFYQKVVSIN